MASSESSCYYDIDDFLADEEIIPCSTQFDFALLAHLKADATSKERHLPKKTKLQMSIWTLREWSRLNYVRLSVPKKYSSSARNSVKADPLNFELTDSYFRSGKAVANLLPAEQASEAADLQKTLLQVSSVCLADETLSNCWQRHTQVHG